MARWIEGNLPTSDRADLARHLAACDDCRRTVALAAEALEMKPEPLEAGAEERWLRRLRRPRARIWSAAAAAAVLLLACGLLVWKRRPAPPVPEPERISKSEDPKPPRTDLPTAARSDETPAGVPKSEIADEPSGDSRAARSEEFARAETRRPHETRSDPYEPLVLLDGSGDLWFSRSEGEEPARVSGAFRAGYRRLLQARTAAASFTVDGRATVAIEKETKVWVAQSRRENAYVLDVADGAAFVDTEGMSQAWRVLWGTVQIFLPSVHGRIFLLAVTESLELHVLQGKIEVAHSGSAETLEGGRSLSLDPSGAIGKKAGDAAENKRRLARLAQIRPSFRTAFLATFDETAETRPFGYTIANGRMRNDPSPKIGNFLLGESTADSSACAALRLDREVRYLNGMVLRFGYRTNVDALSLQAGKYVGRVTLEVSKESWRTAEVPIEMLEDEGVPIVSGEPIREIRFALNEIGTLEIDAVELVRSAQFAK